MTDTPKPFHGSHAEGYDRTNSFWSPLRAALDFTMLHLFRDLPEDARMLCVGAGTGAEIDHLARHRPGWHFVALDLSPDMLDICRAKDMAGGYADRCRFHAGPVETLPADVPFDVATSLLVSQFITGRTARRDFFAQIARHLRPGGHLLTADLSTPATGAAFDAEVDFWLTAPQGGGVPAGRGQFDAMVAVLPPGDLCDLIADAGFTCPRQVFQCLLMRCWLALRAEDIIP